MLESHPAPRREGDASRHQKAIVREGRCPHLSIAWMIASAQNLYGTRATNKWAHVRLLIVTSLSALASGPHVCQHTSHMLSLHSLAQYRQFTAQVRIDCSSYHIFSTQQSAQHIAHCCMHDRGG